MVGMTFNLNGLDHQWVGPMVSSIHPTHGKRVKDHLRDLDSSKQGIWTHQSK